MKLDSEQDRQVLLGLIQQSTISGAAVVVVADLVQRIQAAEVEEPTTDAGRAKATSPG